MRNITKTNLINLISLTLCVLILLFMLSLKSWTFETIESIDDNPCLFTTKLVLEELDNNNIITQFGEVTIFPNFKNLKCIGSVIFENVEKNSITLISGFNKKYYFVASHLIPLPFFILWSKKFINSKNLFLNLICWTTLIQLFFLYFNNLSIFNYFFVPYIYILFLLFDGLNSEK